MKCSGKNCAEYSYWMGLILTAILVAGSTATAREQPTAENPTRSIQAIQLTQITPFIERSLPGKILAATESRLSFRVPGQIEYLRENVVGQQLKKGDIIAKLDATDYKHSVNRMTASLKSAQAQTEQAQQMYKRNQKLWADENIPEMELINSRSAYLSAADEVTGLKAQLQNAVDESTYTVLKAPTAGSVTEKFVDNHDFAGAGTPIVGFIDTKSLDMKVNLTESLFLQHKRFRTYECHFPSLPNVKIAAVFKELGMQALPPTDTYPLTVTLEPQDADTIYPGMTASLIISIGRDTTQQVPIFDVPLSSVFSRDGKTHEVWLYDSTKQTVFAETVEIIGLSKNGVEISGKLTTGDWIVTAGIHELHNGQKVILLK